MKSFSTRLSKIPLLFVAVAAVLGLHTHAFAQQAPGGMAQSLVGAWTLDSVVVEQDGKKTEPFGSGPRGSLMLSADGRFMVMLMRASLPKFAANSRTKGTAEENQAVVQGSIAYFGRYTANEADKTLSLHIDGSTFPNWDAENQKRVVTLAGDELKIANASAAIGGTSYQVWKRAK